MSAADWEKYRAPLYERPPTVTPAWLTEHTAAVEKVLAEHDLMYGPNGQICSCGYSNRPTAGEVERGVTQQEHHRAHQAQEVTAALAAEAEKGTARADLAAEVGGDGGGDR